MLLDMQEMSGEISAFDVYGEEVSTLEAGGGFVKVEVPRSGYLMLRMK